MEERAGELVEILMESDDTKGERIGEIAEVKDAMVGALLEKSTESAVEGEDVKEERAAAAAGGAPEEVLLVSEAKGKGKEAGALDRASWNSEPVNMAKVPSSFPELQTFSTGIVVPANFLRDRHTVLQLRALQKNALEGIPVRTETTYLAVLGWYGVGVGVGGKPSEGSKKSCCEEDAGTSAIGPGSAWVAAEDMCASV